jgi:hypothetical protein
MQKQAPKQWRRWWQLVGPLVHKHKPNMSTSPTPSHQDESSDGEDGMLTKTQHHGVQGLTKGLCAIYNTFIDFILFYFFNSPLIFGCIFFLQNT